MAFLVIAPDDFLVASTDDFLVTALVDEVSASAATYMSYGFSAVMTPAAEATLPFTDGDYSLFFDFQPTVTPPPAGGIGGVNLAAVPASGIRIGAVAIVKARSGATIIWE